MDPTKCMICQGSLGLHPLKVKVNKRIGRICNRVDAEHAGWLLDRKMDAAYIKITQRRRGGIMGLMILMTAFLALLWIFAYSTEFKGPIMAAAGSFSIIIGLFLYTEYLTITVGPRMRDMLMEVAPETGLDLSIRDADGRLVGAHDLKGLGKVMGVLSKQLSGKASGAEISRIVKEELGTSS